MSTTFAVKLTDEKYKSDNVIYIDDEKYIEIAQRYGIGGNKVGITWLEISLIDALYIFKGVTSLQDIKVVPTDNTAQGVETIRDLIKLDKYGVLSEANKFYYTDYKSHIDKIRGLNELVEDQAKEIETLKLYELEQYGENERLKKRVNNYVSQIKAIKTIAEKPLNLCDNLNDIIHICCDNDNNKNGDK